MEEFFNPRSVAVIGASRDHNKIGHVILKNLLTAGFTGKIFPINPNAETILGVKTYPSVLNVPEHVETAIISVPAKLTTQVAEECGKKKIKNLIVVAAGFSEVGESRLSAELFKIVRKYGMRMIGPNCLGTLDTYSGFDNIFLPRSRLKRPEKGLISFICQSGAVGSATLDLLSYEGMKFSKFVSYGNALDIDESDLLEYLGNDPQTGIICMYIEGINDGKKFMRIASKITKKKPIVVIKGGVTSAGARAALSHTASLAGAAGVYKGAFRQCGIIEAEDLEDLFNVLKVLEKCPPMKGKRVQVVTNGGGFGILASDALMKSGMEMPSPSEKTKAYLKKELPPEAIISNPLDLTGSVKTEEYRVALDEVMKDKQSDAVLLIVLVQTPLISQEVIDIIAKAKKKYPKKPLVVVTTGGEYTISYKRKIENVGVPCFQYPSNAAKALAALWQYKGALRGN